MAREFLKRSLAKRKRGGPKFVGPPTIPRNAEAARRQGFCNLDQGNQTVRKLAFRLETGSLRADFCDGLAFDRSEQGKFRRKI
ncbi:MAG: hypothetical protein ABR929_05345 [Roseiarcus sp.]|jgi:hypothetical protein